MCRSTYFCFYILGYFSNFHSARIIVNVKIIMIDIQSLNFLLIVFIRCDACAFIFALCLSLRSRLHETISIYSFFILSNQKSSHIVHINLVVKKRNIISIKLRSIYGWLYCGDSGDLLCLDFACESIHFF